MTGAGRTVEHVELPVAGWPETRAERNAVREQLERILSHPVFRHSKRYPSLLRYVVEHTLEGDAGQLKERTLGVQVFGRDPHYDTNLDPVVRTTAGEIRKRIAQYYHEPGHDLEIRIDLPSGSYLPEFHLPTSKPAGLPSVRPRVGWAIYLWISLALAAILAVIAWQKPWAPQSALERFWSPVLASSSPVLLCLGPANLSEAIREVPQSGLGPPVAQEASPTLRDVQNMEAHHVAVADAATLSRLAGLLQARGKPYHIRMGISTTLSDLRDGPVVLIGAFNNGWTLRLTNQLRFNFERDQASHLSWINDRQKPSNRQWMVDMSTPNLKLAEDYAVISRVLDPTTEQVVVVAAGIGIYGTMAAGEFLTDPTYMEALVKQAPGDWHHKNIQAVIATKVINGNSGPPRVIATYFW